MIGYGQYLNTWNCSFVYSHIYSIKMKNSFYVNLNVPVPVPDNPCFLCIFLSKIGILVFFQWVYYG